MKVPFIQKSKNQKQNKTKTKQIYPLPIELWVIPRHRIVKYNPFPGSKTSWPRCVHEFWVRTLKFSTTGRRKSARGVGEICTILHSRFLKKKDKHGSWEIKTSAVQLMKNPEKEFRNVVRVLLTACFQMHFESRKTFELTYGVKQLVFPLATPCFWFSFGNRFGKRFSHFQTWK